MDKLLVLYSILILISGLIVPRLNKKQLELANSFVVRLIMISLIVYLGTREPVSALLIMVMFVSLVYHLNRYKMKKTFDISLEVMHEQHQKENPGPDFQEVDMNLIYHPNQDMGTNLL